MDPVSALGLVSSCVAIFDGLKEAYRFGRDVIKADDQRREFEQQLDYVGTVMKSLDAMIASEKAHPDQAWVGLMDPQAKGSPLRGLQLAIDKMNAALKDKNAPWRQKLRNFEWPSEKKVIAQYFVEINGFCSGISAILVSVNIGMSRDTYSIVQSANLVTQETNLITKTLAAKFEEDRAATQKLQEEHRIIQEEEEKRRDELVKKEIETWLSPFDFQARRSEKVEGAARVGQYFLDSPEFKNWKNGEIQFLRCYGPTGAGKTILSAIVADHLIQLMPPRTPILCIYFEQKPSLPQSPSNILGSLLKQLIQIKDGGVPAGVKDAYLKATRINAKLTLKEIKGLLETEIDNYEKLFIVIDAMDEASEDSQDLVERYIRRLYPSKVKLMTTRREDFELSRDMILCNLCQKETLFWYHCIDCPQTDQDRMDLCESCQDSSKGCPTSPSHHLTIPKVFEKVIRTPESDLTSFVTSAIQNQMPEDPSEDDPAPPRGSSSKLGWECYQNSLLLSDIVAAIVQASKGRFLLAKQYTRSIGSKQTLGAIKRAVKELANDRYSLSEMIDRMYDDDMEIRIKGQEPEKARYALRILAVVSTAHRNLSFKELQHALATWEADETTTEYDPDDLLDRQDVLNRTKGLVQIDTDSAGTVRLDHRTLEEYFEKTRSKHFPTSETDMATICLKYLQFDAFSKPCDEIEDFAAKERSHPFVSYAVQYWGDHVRESTSGKSSNFDVVERAVAYLQTPLRLEAYIQAGWASITFEHDKWDVRRTIHPLHACAWFDLYSLISALDYKNMDLDVREKTYGQTALMYACRRGNGRVARRLMELGASVNLVSGRGRTALFEAVLSKHEEIVELLLSADFQILDVNVNVINDKLFNRTPLMIAAHRAQLGIVRKLLGDSKILVNLQDSEGNTALSLAAAEGHADIVSALLNAEDLELDLQEKQFGRTALSWAAEQNHPDVVELLLSRGAKPDLKDMRGGYAALRAAEEGSFEALQKLLSCDVDVTLPDEDGCTPLHLAASNGHVEILKIIVDNYSDINVQDQIGMTPFHRACLSGELETGQLLINMGADPCIEDKFHRTPFIVAWQYDQHNLMGLCRTADSTVDVRHDLQAEALPMWSLVIRRHIPLLESALSKNPGDLTVKEQGTENNVLHLAIIQQNGNGNSEEVVKLLRTLLPAANKCLDEPDNCGRSPLHLAALFGNTEAVEVLLEHEPQLSEPDRFGLTPLAIAFRNEYFPAAVMLVEAGSDIPASKIDKQQMLFKAIELQNVKAVEFLVQAGADATIPDEFGRTVNHLAKLSGERRLMHLVQSIKSSVWQIKRAGTTKTSTTVEVVEILKEITADQFPTPNQLPIRDTYDSTIPREREAIAMCA